MICFQEQSDEPSAKNVTGHTGTATKIALQPFQITQLPPTNDGLLSKYLSSQTSLFPGADY